MQLPEKFANSFELEAFLAQPSAALIDFMRQLKGDIMILGVAGKMGVTMAKLAANAIKAAGVDVDDIDALSLAQQAGSSKARCTYREPRS